MFLTGEMLLVLTIILLNIRYVTAIVLDVNDPRPSFLHLEPLFY